MLHNGVLSEVNYMANKSGNWFSDNWEAQLLMYGICTAFSAFYVVDAVRELLSPQNSAAIIESIGTTGFYALTIIRLVVCAWAAIAFARMAWKVFQERDSN